MLINYIKYIFVELWTKDMQSNDALKSPFLTDISNMFHITINTKYSTKEACKIVTWKMYSYSTQK